ncbi:MAG: tRNA (adenosine(37)-N6)-threonylcarbamoyltransferase complex ATPase subunit type 1 TsaE [bacterium]|nr:tRNA (adenosine(37)-N6)-threonylcarbamoyltransferase complex ATPase subunit type 1 TsaE [bacterium]MDN5835295.1 tRNA (adenosine(37)-N6)-threonylcarbamoyltransferase complex ATPase subunit type 1 TsaE [bacterium]
MLKVIDSDHEMREFGQAIGSVLGGGEVIELIGDVGSGKTTLTKGIGLGLDVTDSVQSPSFTINRVYSARDDLELAHYDFYRLDDSGIMSDELSEAINRPDAVTVIEWGGLVDGVLPDDRLTIRFVSPSETTRQVEVIATGDSSRQVLGKLSDDSAA